MTDYHRFLILITSFSLLIVGVSIWYLNIPRCIIYQKIDKELTILPNIDKFEVIEVNKQTVFTAYSLSKDETDENPCIGASNHNLCELRKTKQICASRDLPLHSIIYIEGIGECEILDRMNIRYKGTGRIDILMENKQKAIEFGIKKLKYNN